MKQGLLQEIFIFLENGKKTHYYCEDGWYNCPKHPEGGHDPAKGTDCDCGADEYNKKANKLIRKIKRLNNSIDNF